MKLTSKKSKRIIYEILELQRFKQVQLSENLNVSIGRVNSIVKFLISNHIVIKENGLYSIIRPNYLIELISKENSIEKKFEFLVALDKEKFKRYVKKYSILCLFSALESYDETYNDKEVHVYYSDALLSWIKKEKIGNLKINIYKSKLKLEDYEIDKEKRCTNIIRTLIDLKSYGFSGNLDRLILKKWGTLQ